MSALITVSLLVWALPKLSVKSAFFSSGDDERKVYVVLTRESRDCGKF